MNKCWLLLQNTQNDQKYQLREAVANFRLKNDSAEGTAK